MKKRSNRRIKIWYNVFYGNLPEQAGKYRNGQEPAEWNTENTEKDREKYDRSLFRYGTD